MNELMVSRPESRSPKYSMTSISVPADGSPGTNLRSRGSIQPVTHLAAGSERPQVRGVHTLSCWRTWSFHTDPSRAAPSNVSSKVVRHGRVRTRRVVAAVARAVPSTLAR